MPRYLFLILALSPFCSRLACAHAPPTPIPVPPLRVEANQLVDSKGTTFLLRGVDLPGLEAANPTPADLDARQALTLFTFRILQQRWNMNAVRLPVSPFVWKRDGQTYLDRIGAAVSAANQANLVVILAAYEDLRSGVPDATGLPSADLPNFWSACALYFKSRDGVIFSLFDEPSTRNIPGSVPGVHRPADWRLWLEGGPLAGGRVAIGMQTLANAIRSVGAQQIISVSCFHDALDFQGFGPDFYLRDAGVLYEVHPSYDQGISDDARQANFGFLSTLFPVFAGAWGMPFGRASDACRAIPADVQQASDLLFASLAFFDRRNISWVVADFQPASLIQNFTDYSSTLLNKLWTCDSSSDPSVGIGQLILLWMTGDPSGFGSLDPSQVASLAGGPAESIAPGELIGIFGQLVGPAEPAGPLVDASGAVATDVAGTQVFFDGVAAPILRAGYFQTNVQVPYEVAGQQTTEVQLVYRGVPSNKIRLPLLDASPGILTLLGTNDAAALNQDGIVNNPSNPAARGSIITVFATGAGQTMPPSATGALARDPLAVSALPAGLYLSGIPSEVVYAGAAPGLLGVMQINARLPASLPVDAPPQRISVRLSIGSVFSRSGVTFWVK